MCTTAVLGLALILTGAPPRVVSITPENGDARVDPALSELRVEFDQDMATSGYAWTGGGPAFPQTTGKPEWKSPRVCVLPVKLVPGHSYSLGINGGRFTGFQNPAGEPAEALQLWFHTSGGDPVPALTPEQNRVAIGELRTAIDGNYSYRDRLGLDWDALFAEFNDRLGGADNPYAFALAVRDLLSRADDQHISLRVGEDGFWIPPHPTNPNFDGRLVSRVVPGLERRSDAIAAGRFGDGIGYVLIQTWDRGMREQIEAVQDVLTEMKDAPGLIIDVRPNSGGDEAIALDVAGRFVNKPTPYAKHRSLHDGVWGEVYTRTVQPADNGPGLTMPVCVLIGPGVMSSDEAYVLMMRAAGATLVGAPTYGSTGNPHPHELSNGVTVLLPSWRATDLDGNDIEGVGVQPDIRVEAESNSDSDPIIDAALENLRR